MLMIPEKLDTLQKLILPIMNAELDRGFPKPTFRPLAVHFKEEWLSAFPLRGFLVKAGYDAGSRKTVDILQVVTAIELTQLASLVIDDVVDCSEIRNGASANRKFGINACILAAEILKSRATVLFLGSFCRNSLSGNAAKALKCFESTYLCVSSGQLMDIWHEGKHPINESRYLQMIGLTTAGFLEGAIGIGAILGGAPELLTVTLRKYAWSLGMALQLYDDALDLLPQKFQSKPVAHDVRRRKQRLPLLRYLRTCAPDERSTVYRILRKPELTDNEVKKITRDIIKSGALNYTINKGREFSLAARSQAREVPDPKQRALLLEFIEFLQPEKDEVIWLPAYRKLLLSKC
jgi:geranylgeranyl pyrophosphate synthase